MKFNRITYTLLIAAAALLGACTANYEDINRNPNEVLEKEKERDGYNIIGAMLNIQNWVVPSEEHACQFTENMLGGSYSGYFADSNSGWNGGKFGTFNAPNNWLRVFFQDFIPEIYPNLDDLAEATDDPIPLAVAQVMKIAAMHRVTDTYGPIPYSHIGEGLEVEYDSQQDIYEGFFEELDGAIATLTLYQGESFSSKADKVFYGDVKNWVRFANSLKLRLAMRIVYADPAGAQLRAEQAVTHEIGVMEGNEHNAALRVFGNAGNPILKAATYNSATGFATGGDHHAGADITCYMNGYGDPRRAAYFIPSTFASPNTYMGLRSGITIPTSTTAYQYSGIKLSTDSPLQWMNAAEVAFLRAEGALRGWSMGGTAQSFYETGIRLSFEQWGATGADAYLANSTAKPAAYADPNGTYSYATPSSTITVKWADGDFEASLERIIVQKWIANWTLGNESWAERRRTGYPRLMPVMVNNSNGGVLGDSDTPRRLPYPLEEYQTNLANVSSAVSTLLGGADNMATRVWWDCK